MCRCRLKVRRRRKSARSKAGKVQAGPAHMRREGNMKMQGERCAHMLRKGNMRAVGILEDQLLSTPPLVVALGVLNPLDSHVFHLQARRVG